MPRYNGMVRYAVWADDQKKGVRQAVIIGPGKTMSLRLVTQGAIKVKNGLLHFWSIRNAIEPGSFVVIRAVAKGVEGKWMGLWKDFKELYIKTV